MHTQTATIDVVRVAETMRIYTTTTTRAVTSAAHDTARVICEKLTTQRAALDLCERMFDAAHVAKVTATDASVKQIQHSRCVVLAHAYEVIRANNSRVLRKTLAVTTTRRVQQQQ